MQATSLLREIGTLKEQLDRERRRRERASENAAACQDALTAAQQEASRLRYVASGLEDEVRSERRWRKEQAQTTRASMHALASRLPLVEKAIQARARATQGACRATMRQLAALRQVILEAVPPGSSPGMPRTRALSLLDAACEELQALDKGPASGARSPLDSPQQASFFLQSTPPAAADPDLDPRDLFQQEGAAAAAAAGTPASVHSAMARMEAVVPRYRAAAVAAQTQTGLMREALAVAERERDAAAEECKTWRAAAERYEAKAAELGGSLHEERERASRAAAEAAARLQDSQHEAARAADRAAELAERAAALEADLTSARADLAEARALTQRQRETAARLEALIDEQAADVSTALQLVARRGAEPGALPVKRLGVDACAKDAWHIPSVASAGAPAPRPDVPLEELLAGLGGALEEALSLR
ncbi:hypothetical protein ACKKBG_A39175 [Auxenochlorella protothecoides x Auxenochlorella symbiontica]